MALFLGLPGNAIILQAYARKKRKTSTDILIMAQASVDFIACVFTPVFIFASGFPDLVTDGLCQMTAVTGELTAHTTLLLTTAISIDRYVVVCHPFRRRMTVRMSISLLIICTLFATAFSSGIAVLTEPHAVICNGRRLCIISSSNSTGYLAFEMTFAALFFVSFTTTTLFYALIYAFLRKRAKIHAELVNNDLPLAAISSKNSSLESNSRIDQPETNQHSSPLEIYICLGNWRKLIKTMVTDFYFSDVGRRRK
ncbi:G-protein coupled receptor 1-like [Strongylocentrotus purpuratus]|uniref:G-protein coupled receptors family 1 profile domain-containing protein n=1 Tax=Strongylocentrotus purpuratus TaxID=7668 RepID=A0A7M7PPQ4_STRPU|nr:G-protein coupled receptor 1-like [Strongylocentrotus purpuratus]